MSWEVYVSGDDNSLRYLAKSFADHDPAISTNDRGWVLTASEFQQMADADAVRKAADAILASLSASARLLIGLRESLQVHHLEQLRADGTRNIIVQVEPAVIRITVNPVSLRVTGPAGAVIEERHPADAARRWVPAAMKDERVAKALRLRNKADLNWADLYRIFEIIAAAVGGPRELSTRGWMTERDATRFKHTANSAQAAGDDARHGVERTHPPAKPLPLADARALIDGLLTRWLDSLP